MADWKIELAGKEYQLHYLNDLADSQATELYELLKELIETGITMQCRTITDYISVK